MKPKCSCRMDCSLSNYNAAIFSIILLGLLGSITSCAPRLSMRELSADSPQSAFEQLVSLNSSLINFQADGNLQIALPSGYYNLQAKVRYQQNDRWLIHLNGPFGLRLANIETDGNRYMVEIRLTGASFSGYLDEPFTIQSLDIELPRLDIFVNLMLPVIDINYDYYVPMNELSSVNDSLLVINYIQKNASGRVRLKLSFDPLIVYSEERIMGGKYLYIREFEYDTANSYLPESIRISHDSMSVDISYDNIQYHDKAAKGVTEDAQL